MIHFTCSGCGRKFHVPNKYAGKKATCNTCKANVVVPMSTDVSAYARPLPSSAKLPVRTRRLVADLYQMHEQFDHGRLIRLQQASGEPAEVYKIEFNIRGIESIKNKEPVIRSQHVAEIRLGSEYPRLAPICKMLTPIFHPNIDASMICVGDHWVAGERLTDLVVRIGQMIAYQAYNIKSPLNGEAAMWADLNPDALPIDSRDLYPAMLEHSM
jgi:ubiquitin-protein ligase